MSNEAVAMHDAFLRTIIAEPGEDVHRLVYADWLEEQGQPERGEFIRCQVKLAKKRERHSDECPCLTCKALRRRERELYIAHWESWTELLRNILKPLSYGPNSCTLSGASSPQVNWAFRRGFVAEVALALGAWVGERCRQCDGDGRLPLSFANGSQCQFCSGFGITGRYGPRLIRCAPLEYVRLSDREPWQSTHAGMPDQYAWFDESQHGNLGPASLPRPLFELLPKHPLCLKGYYPTRQAALDALSAACLQWARYAAELEDARAEIKGLTTRVKMKPWEGGKRFRRRRLLEAREAELSALVEGRV